MEDDINSSCLSNNNVNKNDKSILNYSVDYSGASSFQDILNMSVDMKHRRRGFIVSPEIIDEFNKTINDSFLNISMNNNNKTDESITINTSITCDDDKSSTTNIQHKKTKINDLLNNNQERSDMKKKLINLNNTDEILSTTLEDKIDACVERFRMFKKKKRREKCEITSSSTPVRYNYGGIESKLIIDNKSMDNYQSPISQFKEKKVISTSQQKITEQSLAELKPFVGSNESTVESDELSRYDFDPISVINNSSVSHEESYRNLCTNKLKEREKRKENIIESQNTLKRKRESKSSDSSDSLYSEIQKSRKKYALEEENMNLSLNLNKTRKSLRSRAIEIIDCSTDSSDESLDEDKCSLTSTKSTKKNDVKKTSIKQYLIDKRKKKEKKKLNDENVINKVKKRW